MQSGSITAYAHAKINLFLHIVGRRADGYHLLDTGIVFLDLCDRIDMACADHTSLVIDEVRHPELKHQTNIMVKAAQLLKHHAGKPYLHTIMHLDKQIPIAAGMGGGSADAAAVLKALNHVWQLDVPHETLMQLGLSLGADVPVCLYGNPARVTGIGESIKPLKISTPYSVLVVNPNIPLATADVFAARLSGKDSETALWDEQDILGSIQHNQNDLQAIAIRLVPEIGEIIETIQKQPGCLLARMSGSGATCFGLFADDALAKNAEIAIKTQAPNWWVRDCKMLY